MKFSVLISVYKKEKAEFFERALESIYDEQVLKPEQIVLVEDGELSEELYSVVDDFKARLGDILCVVSLKENVGLGDALNEGLKYCKYEYVARMDSDDVSLPNRFLKQIEFLKQNPDVDVLGSWIGEFEDDESNIIYERKLPELHESLVKYAKSRCPLNHVSVVYKKKKVQQAGLYDGFLGIEDYYLWAKLILGGSKFHNIQESLVSVRAGDNMFDGRGGLKYALMEIKLFNTFFKMGFINVLEYLKILPIKTFARLSPGFVRRFMYKISRKV
jgi:glycosyltransferase involved in cell wall biosynthesis